MEVLITGGAGFIGSTIASALADAGHRPVLLDNLATGRREFTRGHPFYQGDVADPALVNTVLDHHPAIGTVIHCAALITVPESVTRPLQYYRANVTGTLTLVETLLARGVTDLVFSSSASIYLPDADLSVDESSALAPSSPYARSKLFVEQMLADVAAATPLRVLSLRYFNPIGADPGFRTGLQVARPQHVLGKLIEADAESTPFLLTGVGFPTRDGSALRDYVHVWDLAAAHLAALEHFETALAGRRHVAINLGSGTGTTVRELVAAFEGVTGRAVDVRSATARAGDTVGAYTRSGRAARMLGWTPRLTLEEGIADTLTWFARRSEVLPELARPSGPALQHLG